MFVDTHAQFTRPADVTAYTANDLVANSTVAGSVVPLTFSLAPMRGASFGMVVGADLQKSTATVTAATFVLHLFDRLKTLTNGDNGALVVNNYDGYVASIPIDLSTGAISIAGGPLIKHNTAGAIESAFEASGGSLYGYLQVTGAYAPGSAEIFSAHLHIEV